MSSLDLTQLTVRELAEGFAAKKFTSVAVTRAYLDRIKKYNGQLNVYTFVDEDGALKMAEESDKRFAAGTSRGPLEGVPCGIKDIFAVKGMPNTACSNILRDFVPPFDATTVTRLRDAGAVFLGKTNLDEFACGSSTEHSCFGLTKNPWDMTKVAGGSSGGSAAAIPAGMAAFTLGTDTGGSIRLPASFCSAVGVKVTYGRTSRSGVVSMASSLDTIGPFTKNAEDAAIVLNVIAGHDPRDSTTPDVPVPDYTADLAKSIRGLRIGLPKEYFAEGIDPQVRGLIDNAVALYKKMGAEIKEISLPMTKYGVAIYYIIMPAELSANLARYDGIRFGPVPNDSGESLQDMYYRVRGAGFGAEIKRRIMIGTYVLSAGYYDAFYSKAQKVRTLILRDFDQAFEQVDVLLTPVVPFPAFSVGEKMNDPLAMYLADAFTIPANAAGIPGLSVPCGFTKEGLPVGFQLLGKQFSESLLFQTASAYERETNFAANSQAMLKMAL
jgi:aspartyl-tRNA(Asn)/glutamyl-tRNA(Gln) amidotransferase subunit A